MPITAHRFESKDLWLAARAKRINSTETPMIFGISPYGTAFSLFHHKAAGTYEAIDENDRMKWGKRLEPAIAAGVAEDEGLVIRPVTEYLADDDRRLGSSFDFFVLDADGEPTEILEVKNVDSLAYRDGWLVSEDGEHVEAPPHIEMQVQHQLLIARAFYPTIARARIVACIGGNSTRIVTREPDPVVHAAIEAKVAEFWARVDANDPPAPNWAEDADLIAQLASRKTEPPFDASNDQEIEALVSQYRDAQKAEADAKERKTEAKAQILHKVGGAVKVIGRGYSIACGITKDSFVEAHTRPGYKQFRLYFKGEKARE